MSADRFTKLVWGAVGGCLLCLATGVVLGHGFTRKPPRLVECFSLEWEENGRAIVATCEGDRLVRQLSDAVTIWCECPKEEG